MRKRVADSRFARVVVASGILETCKNWTQGLPKLDTDFGTGQKKVARLGDLFHLKYLPAMDMGDKGLEPSTSRV